jgi:hypothetical protein
MTKGVTQRMRIKPQNLLLLLVISHPGEHDHQRQIPGSQSEDQAAKGKRNNTLYNGHIVELPWPRIEIQHRINKLNITYCNLLQ